MRTIMTVFLFLAVLTLGLHAKNCSAYESDYDMAKYAMQEKGNISYRNNYDLVNTLIDAATEYLGYCSEKITLAEQYQIQQVIKRADKNRREYFKGAVREYHAIYGIRPNVREIYQDGGGYSSGGGRSSGYSSPPRFPQVRQPQ